MYTGNLYLIVWFLVALVWAVISFVIFKKSDAENRIINVGGWFGIGAIFLFLAFSTNPFREDGTASSRERVNFSTPSFQSREVPERIFVEPQLTDERRLESLHAQREAARERELFEFGEVLGHKDESESKENEEETQADNKGD